MLESFLEYLSDYEAHVLQHATLLQEFSGNLQGELVSLYMDVLAVDSSLHPCINLKKNLVELARHEMLTVPLKALHFIYSGVPVAHRPFWEGQSVDNLYALNKLITVPPSQIMKAIVPPDGMSVAQERVFGFLLTFVGNLAHKNDIQKFMRFVTGSSVNVGKACNQRHI